jgi:hypothetical protein
MREEPEMKTEPKRCTARGNLVKDTRTGAPTEEKLADGQLKDHYVLCPEDRAKGYVEPYRKSYVHEKCGGVTTMPVACAETYAVQPEYYGRTFCCHCGNYFPVGEDGEFVWADNREQKVGTRRER